MNATNPIRWNLGICEDDKTPHLENENHICLGWRKASDEYVKAAAEVPKDAL